MKRNFLSGIACLLVLSLLSPYLTVVVSATYVESNDVCIDEYITENYAVILFSSENLIEEDVTYYAITLESNDKIEFAAYKTGGFINSVWMTLKDIEVDVAKDEFLSQIHDNRFLQKVKDYGVAQIIQGNAEVFCVDVLSFSDDVSYPVPFDLNYGALKEKMEKIHGSEHVMKAWHTGESKYGLYFEYMENLDFSLRASKQFTVTDGMSLGSLATAIAAECPLAYAPTMSHLSLLLGVAALATSGLSRTKIMTYDCEATYERMVLINEKGPYHEAWRQVYYVGLVEMGNDSAPELVKSNQEDYYNPLSSIFNSYTTQRERAYENYKN